MSQDEDEERSLSLQMGFHSDWLITQGQLLHETPSRYDGISHEKELLLRRSACEYIDKIRNSRRAQPAGSSNSSSSSSSSKRSRSSRDAPGFIRLQVVLTAKVLVQRFYTQHSFKTHPWGDVALAALFLAAKVEDRPVKIVVILNKYFLLLDPEHDDFVERSKDEDYLDMKSRVLKFERIILHTLSFNVCYSNSHQNTFLRKVVRRNCPETDWKALESISKTFLNDSFHTVACLLFSPEQIAGAMVYLALRMKGYKSTPEASSNGNSTSSNNSTSSSRSVSDGAWANKFGATKEQITYLSRLMLTMYNDKMQRVGKASPQMLTLMSAVEAELAPGGQWPLSNDASGGLTTISPTDSNDNGKNGSSASNSSRSSSTSTSSSSSSSSSATQRKDDRVSKRPRQ